MNRETKHNYKIIKILYSIIALFFLFIGICGIQRLIDKADLPFKYTQVDGKILIEDSLFQGFTIESIEGHKLTSTFQIESFIDSRSIGDKVSLVLNSNGQNVTVIADLSPNYEDFLFVVISSVVGAFFWLTAIFVLFKRTDLPEARILFWILTLFSIALTTSPGKFNIFNDIPGAIVRYSHILSYLFGVSSFLHFAIIFPKQATRKKLFLFIIYFLTISLSLVLIISEYFSLPDFPLKWLNLQEILWENVFQIFLILSLVIGTLYFYFRYRKYSLKEDKQKIQWILWGNIVGVAPFIMFFVIPDIFGKESWIKEEYLLAFFIVIPISFTFSVIKYHVFDINLVIKRSLLYFTLTAIVLLIYFSIIGVIVFLSNGLIGETDKFLTMIVTFLIVAIFNPLRIKVNQIINRIFFRVKYDFERDINIFSQKLKEVRTLKELSELIIREVSRLIPVNKIALAQRIKSGERLKILAEKNLESLSKNIAALRIFQIKSNFKHPLGLRDYIDNNVIIDDILALPFKKYGISLVIPLEIESDVIIGALILGEKLSEQKYTLKDVEILNVIAAQSVFAMHSLVLQEKLVEEEIEKEKLAELNLLKSQFVSSVSHELQTPLTSIQMFAETLSSGKIIKPEKQQEYYKIIQGESERLGRLISGILNFSKIEKGIREYHFGNINLIPLIKFAIYSLEYQCSKNSININVDFPRDDIIINGDADAVSEAILNLISNAMKYSGKSKDINIKLYRENNSACIKVKDYGIGIDHSDIKHIFDNFYRSRDEMTRSSTGTGLGLSITKHIMDAHKGDIEVKSELRKGSEFILKFPLKLN